MGSGEVTARGADAVREARRKPPGPCAQWDSGAADFIREILDLVGDKWSVLIVGTLAEGPVRYSALADAIPGISQRMLTLTLKHLRRSGIVDRTAYPQVPPRVEYSLTELGASLLSTVLDLAGWSAGHHREVRDRQRAFDAAADRAEDAAAAPTKR
ncbi:winged helix-turn-helix transcriptional regulator [Streptomyces sp. NPDC092903]|uniref:winged helix-turn-helix transcriptional regulator n=1 Tax=Streptomyces sp. NPDC092903 TaxID=3366017 RepID=UPI00380F2E1E